MEFYLADRQGITRAGLMYVIGQMEGCCCKYVEDKCELLQVLSCDEASVVVLDYTLFDFNDQAELLIVSQRFPLVHWVLFSEDLSVDFAHQMVVASNVFGIVMKESPLQEIRDALQYAASGRRFICQRMAEMLLTPNTSSSDDMVKLTKTETEILKCIALGMTTKEIAEKRFSSFHTINTHRKNIFRKLGVNNAHEATKYALRAGLVDSAEYYI